MPKHRLFFDRDNKTINGLLTLLRIEDDGDIIPVFKRLRARSGQRGHTHSSWTRGKSPIPYGNHKLKTTPVKLNFEPYGTPFFPIGSDKGNIRVIKNGSNERWDIGLHFENRFPGSAGCPVVVNKKEGGKLFHYLQHNIDEEYIDFIVL